MAECSSSISLLQFVVCIIEKLMVCWISLSEKKNLQCLYKAVVCLDFWPQCVFQCFNPPSVQWAWMNQALYLDLKGSLTLKVFLSEIFGIICMSVTHRRYKVIMTWQWRVLIWAETMFTFGCVAVNNREFLAVVRVHAISPSAWFTFDLGAPGFYYS